MNYLKAFILLFCMVSAVSCKTAQSVHVQENGQPPPVLVIAAVNDPVPDEFDNSSENPADDSADSVPAFSLDTAHSDAFIQEDQSQDISVAQPAGPLVSNAADTVIPEEEREEEEYVSGEEKDTDSAQPSAVPAFAAVRKEYYIQAGSWKNLKYAQEIFLQLKELYPHVVLIEHNTFHKIRISGIWNKKEGAVISENIERKFNLKPLLVLKIKNTPLDDAVRPFIGTSYKRIDCYGLLVRGLINQGIQYHGQGGLREKLERLALLNGLPGNAYLNGEGLVEKAGTIIFSHFIQRVSDIQEDTEKIYNVITPYLREGIILSFSTTTHGHTGIVSRWEDSWTYINSGLMDNQVMSGEISERVGEEFLKAEIKNWVDLASGRNEPLTVTLGEIDENQVPGFDWSKTAGKLAAVNRY